MEKTLKDIQDRLKSFSSAAIAFSGGVDSTFLLAAAKEAGLKRLVAITVACQFVPPREIDFARKMAQALDVEHICLETNVLENPDVVRNSAQ